jgi:acetyltransferase
LNDEDSNRFLTTYGIPAMAAEMAPQVEDAIRIADGMGYPVVLKIASPDIISRMDVGGVVTGIHSEEELTDEYRKLIERGREYASGARILGVIVQKMIEKIDYEIFLGAKKDREFGAVIVLEHGRHWRSESTGLLHRPPAAESGAGEKLLEETLRSTR